MTNFQIVSFVSDAARSGWRQTTTTPVAATAMERLINRIQAGNNRGAVYYHATVYNMLAGCW